MQCLSNADGDIAARDERDGMNCAEYSFFVI
jgi:hypothetical protein